jgi:hypothetical protein
MWCPKKSLIKTSSFLQVLVLGTKSGISRIDKLPPHDSSHQIPLVKGSSPRAGFSMITTTLEPIFGMQGFLKKI